MEFSRECSPRERMGLLVKWLYGLLREGLNGHLEQTVSGTGRGYLGRSEGPGVAMEKKHSQESHPLS